MIEKIIIFLEGMYASLTANFTKTLVNAGNGVSQKIKIPGGKSFHAEESHIFDEIVLCMAGSFTFIIDSKMYSLTKDQILIIPKNAVHSFFSDNPNDENSHLLWIVCFYDTVRFHITQYGHTVIGSKDIGITLQGIRDDYVIEALEELKNQSEAAFKAASVYLSSFIMLMGRKISGVSAESFSNWDDNIVKLVKSYILANLHKKISLKDISEHVFLSPNYLGYKFKQKTGITINEYIKTERMEKSKYLLMATLLPVSEISKICGFENQFYFSKVFKQETAMPPMQYRKNFKWININSREKEII